MEERLSIVSIMVEDLSQSNKINELLSTFGQYIIGRLGLPHTPKNVAIICIVISAPMEVINTLTGKIGQLSGVSAKTLTSKN